jgi:hypothetical protein
LLTHGAFGYCFSIITLASSLGWLLSALKGTAMPPGLVHLLGKFPQWHWQTWLTIWAVSLLLVTLEGCFRAIRKREQRINELVDAVNGAIDETAQIKEHVTELTNQLNKFSEENRLQREALSAAENQLKQPCVSFSVTSSNWREPVRLSYEEHGQLRLSFVRPSRISASIKKHVPQILEITGAFLQSSHDSTEPDIEFPCHIAAKDEPTELDITLDVLQAICKSTVADLRIVRELSTTFRISFAYASAASKGRTDPQSYRVTTKHGGDRLLITVARL